jgi:hypothetical protein
MNDRKRHILADNSGLLLQKTVYAGDIPDFDGARLELTGKRVRFPQLRRVGVDGVYRSEVGWVKDNAGGRSGGCDPTRGSRCSRGGGWWSGRGRGWGSIAA